jgi:hypothetical protein
VGHRQEMCHIESAEKRDWGGSGDVLQVYRSHWIHEDLPGESRLADLENLHNAVGGEYTGTLELKARHSAGVNLP